MHKILTLGLMIGLLTASNVQAGTLDFKTINQTGSFGEIQGQVVNCSDQNLLEDTLIHIPGKSIATRLGKDGKFHLHFVPAGDHTLALEVNHRDIGKVENIPVKEKNVTQINSLKVCVTEQDRNLKMATHSEPSSSRVRCPKGGFGCQANWQMQKALKAQRKDVSSQTASNSKPAKYVINSEYELVRVN